MATNTEQPDPGLTPADASARQTDRAGLVDLLRAYPARTAAVVVLLILAGLAEGIGVATLLPLLQAVAGQGTVDTDEGPTDAIQRGFDALGIDPTIEALLVVVVLGVALKAVLTVLAKRQSGYAAADVSMDLRLGLIRALMRARWSYFVSQPAGSLVNALSTEADRASRVYLGLADLLSSGIQVVVYLALALVVSWEVTLASLLLGVFMLFSLRFLVRIARTEGERQTIVMRSLVNRLQDGLQNIKPLKAMARENSLRPLLERETEDLNDAHRRRVISTAVLKSAYEPVTVLFLAIGMYVLLTFTSAAFDELLFMAVVFQRTLARTGELQGTWQGVTTDMSAYLAIRDEVGQAEAHHEELVGTGTPTLTRDIRFHDVSFDYGGEPVLHEVDLVLPAGQLTAIVGPSGIGKTTILDLVAGLYRATAGNVLVDGTPIDDLSVAEWRRRIGYVPQNSVLFHDTIATNVTLGEPSITREAVEEALRAADAWDFVSRMPDGIDTVVGEKGDRLSGGQRQRIAIARALVTGPQLLLLDEATASLDSETEREICATLGSLGGKVTLVAVSHQPAIVDVADRVYRVVPGPSGSSVEFDLGSTPERQTGEPSR